MKSNGGAIPLEPLANENRIVEQARSGDAEAFGKLYDAYVERVYRYIFFRVSDVPTAEDITSQVFLKAWQTWVGIDLRDLSWLGFMRLHGIQ